MTAELISRTGRVQSWLDNPESRLPVSCAVFVVEDSMEGKDGIEASWRYVSHGLRFGAGVAVHLSKLRPKGAENGKVLRLLAQYPLVKSTHHLMKHSDVEASTRTVLWYFIWTLIILTSTSLLLLPGRNSHGSNGASTLIRDSGKAVIIK